VIIGIIIISLLLVAIFLIPSGKKYKKKKKIPQTDPSEELKDWEQKVVRLEKYIQSIRSEIFDFQKKEKENNKQLVVERVKVKKFQEKLTQERQWHNKEQGNIDKKGKEFQELKGELVDVQDQFSKTHSANLRNIQKIKDLEQEHKSLCEQRRKVEGENSQLIAKIESNRRDIAQLKKENRLLTKKNDDASWIAKTEYERVLNLLKEKEKELERIVRENKK